MKLSDNPFFVLGATPSDSRPKLYRLADEHCFDTEGTDDALRILTNPNKRHNAELRWFLGRSQSEVSEILSFIESCRIAKVCYESQLQAVRIKNDDISDLNLLLYILPYCADSAVDSVVLKICRCFDAIDSTELIDIINDSRSQAKITPIASNASFESAFREYRNDVCNAVLERTRALRSSSEADYRILINRVSMFGFSQVVEQIIGDYELYEVDRLRHYVDEIHIASVNLQKFFNKDERPDNIATIKSNIACWSEEIIPLQKLADTLGMPDIVRPYKREMVDELVNCCTALMNLGPDMYGPAIMAAQYVLEILPDEPAFEKVRIAIVNLLHEIKPVSDEYEREKYRKAAEEAWLNEQRQYDEYYKKRAEEASAAEKDRISDL